MLITFSRRTAICQSVAEVWLTVVALLGAAKYKFIFYLIFLFVGEMYLLLIMPVRGVIII